MAEVSRRRVVVGAAWATPVILVATSSPPVAASTLVPPPDVAVEINPGGSNVADLDVGITLPPGYQLDSPFTVVIDLPRDNATLVSVTLQPDNPDYWTITPAPGSNEANNVGGVTIIYTGPPNPAPVSINVVFNNGIDSNSQDPADKTVIWSFTGTSGGSPVSDAGSVTLTN